ncbi:unnamed protein product [Closterium sp. NIES-64]|nr:unnamed protein product [Closterium sp. NIES-64]
MRLALHPAQCPPGLKLKSACHGCGGCGRGGGESKSKTLLWGVSSLSQLQLILVFSALLLTASFLLSTRAIDLSAVDLIAAATAAGSGGDDAGGNSEYGSGGSDPAKLLFVEGVGLGGGSWLLGGTGGGGEIGGGGKRGGGRGGGRGPWGRVSAGGGGAVGKVTRALVRGRDAEMVAMMAALDLSASEDLLVGGDMDEKELRQRVRLVEDEWEYFQEAPYRLIDEFWRDVFDAAYDELVARDPTVHDRAVEEIARLSGKFYDVRTVGNKVMLLPKGAAGAAIAAGRGDEAVADDSDAQEGTGGADAGEGGETGADAQGEAEAEGGAGSGEKAKRAKPIEQQQKQEQQEQREQGQQQSMMQQQNIGKEQREGKQVEGQEGDGEQKGGAAERDSEEVQAACLSAKLLHCATASASHRNFLADLETSLIALQHAVSLSEAERLEQEGKDSAGEGWGGNGTRSGADGRGNVTFSDKNAAGDATAAAAGSVADPADVAADTTGGSRDVPRVVSQHVARLQQLLDRHRQVLASVEAPRWRADDEESQRESDQETGGGEGGGGIGEKRRSQGRDGEEIGEGEMAERLLRVWEIVGGVRESGGNASKEAEEGLEKDLIQLGFGTREEGEVGKGEEERQENGDSESKEEEVGRGGEEGAEGNRGGGRSGDGLKAERARWSIAEVLSAAKLPYPSHIEDCIAASERNRMLDSRSPNGTPPVWFQQGARLQYAVMQQSLEEVVETEEEENALGPDGAGADRAREKAGAEERAREGAKEGAGRGGGGKDGSGGKEVAGPGGGRLRRERKIGVWPNVIGPFPPWVAGADEDNLPLTRRVQHDLWLHQHPRDCTYLEEGEEAWGEGGDIGAKDEAGKRGGIEEGIEEEESEGSGKGKDSDRESGKSGAASGRRRLMGRRRLGGEDRSGGEESGAGEGVKEKSPGRDGQQAERKLRRFLLVDGRQIYRQYMGIGAQISWLTGALAEAVRENRIMVITYYERTDHEGCKGRDRARWSCYFAPETTEECRRRAEELAGDKRAVRKGLVAFSGGHSPKPTRFFLYDPPRLWGRPWQHMQRTVEVKGHLIGRTNVDGRRWWFAQATRYLMRYRSPRLCHLANQARHEAFGREVAEQAAATLVDGWPQVHLTPTKLIKHQKRYQGLEPVWAAVREPGVGRRYVAVHVRQGDKSSEMHLLPLSAYLELAGKARRNFPDVTTMWLSTEMKDVVQEATRLLSPRWAVRYTQFPRQGAANISMKSYEADVGMGPTSDNAFVNLVLAAEADLFVGTLGSTWSVLIDNLRVTGGKERAGFLSVNKDRYWFSKRAVAEGGKAGGGGGL